MGLFSKVAVADPSSGGIYPLPGNYTVAIDALKETENFNGDEVFVAELKVLKSTNPARPVGSSMSWVASFKHKSSAGNVKAFYVALFPDEELDEAGLKATVSAEQPCHGMLLDLEAVNILTKVNKTDFTKCLWTLSTSDPAQFAELLKGF
jgi:hypothetical protein